MKTLLRLALLLVAWMALAQGNAWAAPTVGTTYNTTAIRRNNTVTAMDELAVTNGTATGYRVNALPTVGTLYIANAGITAYEVVVLNRVYTPQQALYMAFAAPTTVTAGTYSFGFQAQDATGFSNTGAYYITIQGPVSGALPTAVNRAAPIIPKSFGATSIKALQGAAGGNGAIANYRILEIPETGTLRIAGNATALTAGATITPANAGNLTYTPNSTGAAGNYSFSYQSIDINGGRSNVATYSLPVSNAVCSQNSAIDFSERTVGENWKEQTGVTVANTTVSTTGYSSSVPAGQTNILGIENQPARLSTQGLVWQLNNQGLNGANVSTVQMNFSRPVRNLAFAMEDIDVSTLASGGSDFVDEVTFNAYRVDGTLYQLQASDVALGSNNSNAFVAGTNTIKGTAPNSGPEGTVVLTYPAGVAVSRLEIVYKNTQTYTAANLRLQTVGIPSMVWCAELDLETTLTGSTRVQAGQPVTYVATTTNQGDLSAATVNATVQLAQNLSNVTVNGLTTGFTYVASTGTLTYPIGTLAVGASDTRTIRFTMPTTGSVTGKASTTTTGLDIELNNNNGTLANANVTTVQNRPPVAQNVTAPSMLSTSDDTSIPALVGTDPDGNNTIVSYLLTNIPAASAGTLSYTRNGATVTLAAGNTSTSALRTLTPAEIATLTFDPVASFSGNATFNYTATDDLGVVSNTALYTIPVTLGPVLSGTIFDDVNYGGGAGRTYAAANTAATASGFTSGAIRQAGATVELYDAAGAFVATTTANAQGQYSFIVPAATYTVRVVNSTVNSVRTLNSGFTAANTQAVQTFVNGVTNRVGGEAPERQDAPANTGSQTLASLTTGTGTAGFTAQSITSVTVPAAGTTGIDFGFNFDVVTSTRDAGAGSLRQFIINSNALANTSLAQAGLTTGVETSIFMIPNGATTGAPAGLRNGLVSGLTNGVAVISPATALPSITDAGTAISGATQTTNVGNTNTGTLGTAGTVGIGADGIEGTSDDAVLTAVDRPEVQIAGVSTIGIGLDVQASRTTIRSISILGFGNAANSNTNANIRVGNPATTDGGNYTGILLENNFVGLNARLTTFSSTFTATTASDNIRVIGADGNGTTTGLTASVIQNNLIAYATGKGIGLEGNAAGTYTSTGFVVRNNEIRNNSIGINNFDGVDIEYSSSSIVTGNLIVDNGGAGVDMFSSTGNNTIRDNTIIGNGRYNGENAGVRLHGSGNVVSQNIIRDNVGSGVSVQATGLNNVISLNSISGNGTIVPNGGTVATGAIGIDLFNSADAAASGTSPFVTLNDNGDGDLGANGLTNMPVIQTATIRNGVLYLTGFARPGARLEFFVADANPASLNTIGANFGQGQSYLFTRTEGITGDASATLNDLDATTGSYGQNNATVNGFYQGTETGQNRFSYAIPLSSLTAAQQAALTVADVKLTATATQLMLANGNQGTSEFSGNAPVQLAPVANNDFANTTPGTAITLTVTDNDQNAIDGGTVALNGLTAGSTTAVTVTGGTFTFLSNGQVRFVPAAGFTGVATVPYTVNNTSGTTSNTAFISVAVSGTTFNLATSFSSTPAATVNAGSSISYTVVSSNPGTVAATGVVETVQLPAGLATTSLTVGGSTGSINSSTGVITFPAGSYNQNTGLLTLNIGNLAAGGSTSTALVFPAPLTSPLTVTANISGAGGLETTTADNTAISTINITPRFDVATAISGPTTVTAGNEVTYTVVTRNLSSATTPANAASVSPAVNVEQTVSLPGNLTSAGFYVSNGGTVAYNSTQNTTVVTFPAIGVLAAGQSQVNSFSFTAPSTSFLAPVAIVTSGLTGTNDGDLNIPNNTAQLNGAGTRPTITPATRTGTEANVYTSIAASTANAAPGADITLTITAGNAGSAAANGVQQSVTLPTGLVFTNLNGGTYNASTGVLSFPALTSPLAAGATQTYNVTFAAPQQGFVLATAAVTTTTPDAVPADNVAQTKIEVTPVVDVATTLAGPVVALPGQTVNYTVTTASNGPAAANSVVQTVQLPTGLANVQLNSLDAGSRYNPATGTLSISFATPLAAGFSQTNTISFTAPAGGARLSVAAAVSTSSAETVITNNAAVVTTTLTPTADVAISVTGPATATVGNSVPYAVAVTNNGAAVAINVTSTLQLPAGLGAVNVTFPGGTAADSYNNATGVVTFASVATLASGASSTRVVVVTMPDAAQLSAVGQVATSSVDTDLTNNYAVVATTAATATTAIADLRATLTPATTAVNAGSNVTLTATFSNVGTGTASNVIPQLMLVPGLTGVTVTDGGVTRNADYNATTGVVTFQTVNSLNSNATLSGAYSVSFNAPATGPVQAVASVYSATSEVVLTNNTALATVTVNPRADAQTTIAGPTSAQPGSRVTYEITTSNNSTALSPSTNVVQTVTIPGTPTNLTFSEGASSAVVNGNTVVTFPTVASMAPGTAGAVTNFISFTTPATATSLNITANVTSAVDINMTAASNAANITTIANNAPVAYNVVNNLLATGEVRFNQVIENTATVAQPISPLVATDVNVGQALSYTITSLPTSGSLYVGNNTTPLAVGVPFTATEAGQLRYLPVAGFVGNAFFSYTATDNASVPATSNTGVYTIAVGQDANSVYATTTQKGGATPYVNGDVIANVFDANSGTYNSATPQAVVKNGLTSAALVTTNLPAGVLAAFPAGVGFNTTDANQVGQIVVTNNRLLTAGTYTVRIATVDANGGTNTRDVTFTIGVRPLPVELVSFTAKAVGQDAQLVWRTAQELRNDHFVVERSLDGKSFSSVGQVKGQGSTTTATNYQFTDAQVARQAAGQNVYYRLRQVDLDGTTSFSGVQIVRFAKAEVAISLYPNPASTTATLDLTSLPVGQYQVSILDAVGRVVRQNRYEAGTTPALSVQELPVGSYQVLVSGKDFKQALRLIKE